MTDRTAVKRNAEMRERKQAAGLVRVSVWVPKTAAGELKEIARRLCGEKPQEPQRGDGHDGG